MRKLKGYGLASLIFALIFFQRPPLPHFRIENACSRLVYFPEAPRGYQLTAALRELGPVRAPRPRTDIVWQDGRFRYVNEQHRR